MTHKKEKENAMKHVADKTPAEKRRRLAIWYRTGVINRRTFVYLWSKANTTLRNNDGPDGDD